MRFIEEFKRFAIRGNVVDLSVGVIMGSAFGKIVTSVVEDLFMPMIDPLLAKTGQNWQSIVVGPGIKIGHFVGALLNFFIISSVVFALVKIIHRFKKSEEKVAPQVPTLTEKLLMEIRDGLNK